MRLAVGRAFRDTLDNLLPLFWISIMWWGTTLLIVTAPAGTIALFRATDPARQSVDRRPDWRERLTIVREELVSSWGITLVFAIPVVILISNIARFGGSESRLRLFSLLWVVLLLLILAAAGIACSLHAIDRLGIGQSLRVSILLTLSNALRLLPVIVLLWIATAVSGVLVVPAVMLLPGLVGMTFNHVTAALLGRSISDPLEPTIARAAEEASARASRFSVN